MQRTWWPEAGTSIVTGPYSKNVNFQTHLTDWYNDCFLRNWSCVNAREHFWWKINIGSVFPKRRRHISIVRFKNLNVWCRKISCQSFWLTPRNYKNRLYTLFLAATKQLYEWFSPSVRPSVCPSVRLSVTPFWLCSHHRIIMKFSGVITSDKSDVHAKGQGQRSKVKVTEVTTQLNRFRTVTPVWIHMWWWNDAYSLIMLRRGALLFFKVIHQISKSHGSKNRRLWPRLGISGL